MPQFSTYTWKHEIRDNAVNYNDKSGGGGNYGVDITFDVKKIYGIVIRVDPNIPDIFKGIVRDALQTLDRVRVSLMGQYTLDE